MKQKRVEEGERRRATKSKSTSSSKFVSFQPTKEEKEIIRNGYVDLDKTLDCLEAFLLQGHKLTISYVVGRMSYCVGIRDGSVDWSQAVVVNCWHINLQRAFAMLHYALAEVYTNFPDIDGAHPGAEDDW